MSVPKVIQDIRELRAITDNTGTSVSNLSVSVESLNDHILDMQRTLSGTFLEISGTELNIGDEVYIQESGVLTPFIVVHKDYLTTGNIILLRKFPLGVFSYTTYSYPAGDVAYYIRDTYKASLNTTLVDIQIPYIRRDDSVVLSTTNSVFIPSYTEITGQAAEINSTTRIEGSQFIYFTDQSSRIAYKNGATATWMLRTPSSTARYYYVNDLGEIATFTNVVGTNFRPAISVSSSIMFSKLIRLSTNNILATATISE